MKREASRSNSRRSSSTLLSPIAVNAGVALLACFVAMQDRSTLAGERAGWEDSSWQRLTKSEIRNLGRQPRDIVSRDDLPKILALLKRRGVVIAEIDVDAVSERVLPDNDGMVRYLRTPRGTTFMRRIARYPSAFDRLDRLVRMPYGAARMRELIRGPDGYKLIEYMTTSRGGRNLGAMLSRTRSGGNFNRKTGRLYTVSDVIMFVMKRQRELRADD